VSAPLDRAALADLLRRPTLVRLLTALDGQGEETRIVGGAVRNALLGQPVTEVDCATTATPEVTTARAHRAGFRPVPTGIEHGTITVIVDGEPFEVTSLREDVETDGRRAMVRFGRDFDADARRRDFTINALSLDRRARCTIASAAKRISPPVACASSATRPPAFARITCASCDSSASTLNMPPDRPTRTVLRPPSMAGTASAACHTSGSGPSC
jgi:hypothetical protein